MQCSAKMNMVTFSVFEKQICNILHFLHNFRVHAGADNRARRAKNTPDTPSKPSTESHRENPNSPALAARTP